MKAQQQFNGRRLDHLLTIKKVADLMGVAVVTIRSWKSKNFPYVIIPGDQSDAIRYDVQEVKQWAREHGKRIKLVPRRKKLKKHGQ